MNEAESLEAMAQAAAAGPRWRAGRRIRPKKKRARKRRERQPKGERCIQYLLSPDASRLIKEAAAHTKQTRRYVQEIVFTEFAKMEAAAVKGLVRKVGQKMLQEALEREEQANPGKDEGRETRGVAADNARQQYAEEDDGA